MAEEVKQGFSVGYILLLIIAAFLGGLFQYLFPYVFDRKEMKITYSVIGGTNELTEDRIDKNIIVKYSLKNDTSDVKSYYHSYVSLENTGSVGIEDIDCQIESLDSNIVLQIPNVEENKSDTPYKVDYKVENERPYRQTIKVPLFNKGETISFQYSAYSKRKIKDLTLRLNIRKKDLIVEKVERVANENNFDFTGSERLLIYLLMIMLILYMYEISVSKRLRKLVRKENRSSSEYKS